MRNHLGALLVLVLSLTAACGEGELSDGDRSWCQDNGSAVARAGLAHLHATEIGDLTSDPGDQAIVLEAGGGRIAVFADETDWERACKVAVVAERP